MLKDIDLVTYTLHYMADQQAETALRKANDRFRAAISAVQGVLWTNDAAGRMVGEQPGWAALTGQSAAEYEGYGWAKAVHPDDAQPTIDAWNESVARRETFVFEHRVRRRDGVWRLFSIRAVPLLDHDGLLHEWVGVHTDITDQRAAEDRLREVNARFAIAQETARFGIWEQDFVTGAMRWDAIARDLYGVGPDEIITDDLWRARVHPNDLDYVQASVAAAVAARGPLKGEHRIIKPDGSVRWLSVLGRPVSDFNANEAARATGVFFDITNRKEAEARLRQSEEQLRLAVDAAEISLWDADLVTDTLFWQARTKAMFGISADAPVSLADFYSGLHPDDRERVSAAFAAAIDPSRRALYDVEYRTIGKEDGLIRWVAAKGRGLFDNHGRCLRAIGTVIDITERRAQAEAADASRRLLDAVLEAMPVGVDIADANGRLFRSNPANALLWGEPPATNSVGEYDARVGYWPDGRRVEPHEWAMARALEKGETCHGELVEIERFGGGRRFMLNSAAPVRDAEGRIVAGLVAQLDVTDRVQAERALQALNESLEAQVADRTAELQVAKVTAEAGARVKAEFLANMSHELRTPLTGMLGVHDLLNGDPSLSDRQRHFVNLAQDSGHALLTIVNDILDFSKIEAGQMIIECVPFRLRELVESCRQLGTEAVKAKGVDLTVEVDAGVPDLFLGDPTRIRQVLLNLITNAIKFTSQGGVTVRAAWSSGRLRVEVSDTGVGIPAEVIPYLFERFSQADGSITRRFGGTGLGLAICKRLVELMDGTIAVESAPRQGSTFWFALPLRPAERSQRPEPRRNPLAPAPKRAWRVLLAEDHAINQEIIRTVLTQKGYLVTMVDDGAEAVLAFREGVFDVVLMDVQMPRVDGLSATREIRAIEQAGARARAPVVALTANAMAEEADRCRQAGMDAHVAKPIDWTQLFATIDRLCEQHAATASPEANLLAAADPSMLVLDESALDGLASLLGRDRIGELLLSFERETRRRLGLIEAPSATFENVAHHAHALVSLAGQLGFAELSSFCAGLEAAALRREGLDRIEALWVVADRGLEAASRSSYAAVPFGSASVESNV